MHELRSGRNYRAGLPIQICFVWGKGARLSANLLLIAGTADSSPLGSFSYLARWEH